MGWTRKTFQFTPTTASVTISFTSTTSGGCGPAIDAVTIVPLAFTCNASFYASDDGCDCNCGYPDPDCDTQNTFIKGCPNSQYQCYIASCIPKNYTCNPGTYGDECKFELRLTENLLNKY